MSKELFDKAITASVNFLKNHDYEIIGTEFGTYADIIALDENDSIVFCKVSVRYGEFAEDVVKRNHREMDMIKFFKENPEFVNYEVRFDDIDLVVVSENSAVLRHHINCLKEA